MRDAVSTIAIEVQHLPGYGDGERMEVEEHHEE
jgi:hypothetical protein